jgi:hypothetical protein
MNHSPNSAVALRSLPLIIILYQFRLLAGDLADTPVFAATLACAFVAAYLLAIQEGAGARRDAQAGCILAAIPWAARLFIALPRAFAPETAVTLDSLLLNLDRNNFVALIPFYWAAFSTYFSVKSRAFLRADIVAADALFLVLFSIARTADIAAYRWPILMIAVFAGALLLQFFAFILSLSPELRLRGREKLGAGAVLLALVAAGGALFLGPAQKMEVNKGGGLLEPNLFQFDFSQVLRLESEISMNDDLVLIMKKEGGDDHVLLRRFVLSGYNQKQGFFRNDADELTHPQRLPERSTPLAGREVIRASREVKQEYYLVNFDSSAFIGMNDPALITPFETWDASSFTSAYSVLSNASGATPTELLRAAPQELSAAGLDLSEEEYALYTDYGSDERLTALARELTAGKDNYGAKIQAVYRYFKQDEFRYSLKPGIAPDGDQLGYFLFQSKKGYCSYYAFAFTLLLRSLGIPARVAAGFFIDPETNTFDYYPVRSDMAHSWTEVRFPGYGWIEFDPTSDNLAEDEEFRFSSGVPTELFERLMKEILDNHDRLVPKEGAASDEDSRTLQALGARTLRALRQYWRFMLGGALAGLFALLRGGFLLLAWLRRDPRKKATALWAHGKRRLRLAGYKKPPLLAEPEWARLMAKQGLDIYSLYQDAAAARYAPFYSAADFKIMTACYTLYTRQYDKIIPRSRRILAWLCPPLALLLPPAPLQSKAVGGALALFALLLSFAGDMAQAQNVDGFEESSSDSLYQSAVEAQAAEHWERAISLYEEGARLYTGDSRFPRALGNLYYGRALYGLAWEQYRKAEPLLPTNTELLYRLSRTAGYLNNDTVSAAYLERLLALEPDNREAIGSLGWMYYKLHRLEEGELLLKNALSRFGPDPDFYMTLGTLYSEMFRYEDARRGYLDSITGAEAVRDRLFLAVAHYNLSILETRFYQFNLAFDETNASLAEQNRASGRLARGELFLRRLEFKRVFEEYQVAYELDTSPLSKVNLSQSYQMAGRLNEARLYAEDCLRGGDLSWMINYGIDPVRYKRDLHEILYKTYKGLLKAESFNKGAGIQEYIDHLSRMLSYRFKTEVHTLLFRKYSLLSAYAYDGAAVPAAPDADTSDKTPNPDALLQYADAFEAYPARALTYLRKARSLEEPIIPASGPSYNFEEGRLTRSRRLLTEALAGFDPTWERDMIADVYTELAVLSSGDARRDAAERLFALNRGALRQAGISLPIALDIVTSEDAPIERKLVAALKAVGLTPAPAEWPSRFRLTIRVSGREADCELYDGGRGTSVLRRRSLALDSLTGKALAVFAQRLGDMVFTPE